MVLVVSPSLLKHGVLVDLNNKCRSCGLLSMNVTTEEKLAHFKYVHIANWHDENILFAKILYILSCYACNQTSKTLTINISRSIMRLSHGGHLKFFHTITYQIFNIHYSICGLVIYLQCGIMVMFHS